VIQEDILQIAIYHLPAWTFEAVRNWGPIGYRVVNGKVVLPDLKRLK
jgi:hypothetical protein